MVNRKLLVASWAFLLPATITVLFIAGCKHSTGTSGPNLQQPTLTDASYVGNDACKPCHESEFTSHHMSRHDTTMHPALCSVLGNLTPPSGVVPLGGFSVLRDGDSLIAQRDAGGSDGKLSRNLDLVLGSGKLGMTYVTLINNDSLMETRMSYFPVYKIWDVTPGQEQRAPSDTPFGRVQPNIPARLCLGCHATVISKSGLAVQKNMYGVGCETCHGPGKAHITAMQSGNSAEMHIDRLSSLSPTKLNELCGRCHRNARDVDLDTVEADQTHRFQPYALLRSQCRTKSKEPLSCVYCHNPHTDVSKSSEKYNKTCLACHSPNVRAVHVEQVPVEQQVQGKQCPVNQRTGCVGCHMRPRIAFPQTSVTATMADHLIGPDKAHHANASRPHGTEADQ